MHIGLSELLLIFVLAVALIKPDKLGEYIGALKGIFSNIRKKEEELKEELQVICEPMSELQGELSEIKEEVRQIIK